MPQRPKEGVAPPDEGFMARVTGEDEDDVEGHGMAPREGFVRSREGFKQVRETEDEDVEGHGMAPREGFVRSREGYGGQAKASEDEDDVEGHGFSRSSRTRGE